MLTIDFETKEIINGAPTPPRPVGVAIKQDSKPGRYYAWGHPTKNNCTVEKATQLLRKAFNESREPLLFHNAKFDVVLAMHWFGCRYPAGRVEDTLFLAYLYDPRLRSLKLKDLANDFLGMPPDEQEDLRDWLFDNVKGARQAKKNWGKYICKAPGDLVGKYAVGDVDRTYGLYNHFTPSINDYEMGEAYERELQLLPVIMDMEHQGVPISKDIHEELTKRDKQLITTEKRIYKKLGEVESWDGKVIFNAMEKAKLVDHTKVVKTPTGKPSTAREVLPTYCKDKKLITDLEMRSRLVKVIGTYLRPWAEAELKYGRFYPYFNQTRGADRGGTKTGRLSSNFQQVPKKPDIKIDISYLRNFVIPEPGHVIVLRDYSQQELRILAHYAEGKLLAAYRANPDMDVHNWVKDLIIKVAGVVLDRSKQVKTANFLQVYGGGGPALSKKIGCGLNEAYTILKAHQKALPEIKKLSEKLTKQLKQGILLRTWGGRVYDVEWGKNSRGVFEYLFYKLINLLIQGSAADQTKQLMIDYHYHPERTGRIMIQAHDELVNSAPKRQARKEMRLLRGLMDNSKGWDVPMRSDGKIGPSWGEAVKFDDRV